MKQQLTFINCKDETHLRRLLNQLLRRLDRQLSVAKMSEAAFLHGIIEKNPAHQRYRMTAVLNVPGRTLVSKEDGHDAVQTMREAVSELERQVARHKAFLRYEPLWRRPARRAALERERFNQAAAQGPAREWLGGWILSHLEMLYNFARREIAAALAVGDLMPGELDVEDVVDAVVARALNQADRRPVDLQVDRWLLKLSLDYLDEELARLKKERSLMHIEEDIPETPPREAVVTLGDEILDYYQPDEDLRLEDVIPHPYIPTPDQVKECRDLQRYVNRTLAALPQAWRRAFVLCHVQGLSISEVATVLGETEDRVRQSLKQAQEFLREKIVESGLQLPA
ncbi:MAG TPA: sigma-70 family RNA polymerase sigma factor [Nitrospira sp.]|nr:sigma-70 family RNA polymerase sigma factor [Nitrospira sp.]